MLQGSTHLISNSPLLSLKKNSLIYLMDLLLFYSADNQKTKNKKEFNTVITVIMTNNTHLFNEK